MEFLVMIAIILAVLAIYVVVNEDSKRSKRGQARLKALPAPPADNPYAAEDKKFDDAILKMMGSEIAGHFYTKLVGITQANEGGTVCKKLIPRCKQFEFVDVVWESENKHDPDAIAI